LKGAQLRAGSQSDDENWEDDTVSVSTIWVYCIIDVLTTTGGSVPSLMRTVSLSSTGVSM
jgi:hypothetical protein